MGRRFFLALDDDGIKKIEKSMLTLGGGGGRIGHKHYVDIGSMCSHLNMPCNAMKFLTSILTDDVIELRTVFACETDQDKALHILDSKSSPYVFKHPQEMGKERATAYFQSNQIPIPDCDLFHVGLMMADIGTVKFKDDFHTFMDGFEKMPDMLASFLTNPDGSETEFPELSQSMSEVMGSLCYIRRRRPDMVLMQSVPAFEDLLPKMRRAFHKDGGDEGGRGAEGYEEGGW